MKTRFFALIIGLLALSVLLGGCATGLAASSWASVTADTNNAYLAGGSYVYAVNLQTGAEVWRYPAKASSAPFFAPPAITADGQLIVGGFDHKLYSLNPQNGKLNWQFDQAKDRWIGGVLAAPDALYAPNADYNLYALDLHGNLLWTFEADQSLWAAPVSDGQRVYFGTLGRKVYALDAHTGKEAWVKTMNGAILGSPALQTGSLLFVGTYAGSVVALDPATGQTRWQHPASSWIWAGPGLTSTNLLQGDANGMFYALDPSGGQERWHQKLNGAVLGTPVMVGENIVVGTESGNIYFLDGTGSTLHTVSVTGQVYTLPVSTGSGIVVAPTGATALLVALDQNGTQKWAFTPAK